MKKRIALLGALAFASSAFAIGPYDSMTGVTSYTTTGTNPGFLLADGANTIASPGGGTWQWKINSIDWGMFFIGAQTYAAGELRAHFEIFATYNDNTNPVLAAPIGTVDYLLGAISSTGNAAFGVTGGPLPTLLLPVGTTKFGWTESYFNQTTGARIGTVRAAMTTTVLPTTGTSSQGFWRDVNDNGVIEQTEKFIFGATNPADNMIIRFNGTPVPEPASMVALGLGLTALIARRRKKA